MPGVSRILNHSLIGGFKNPVPPRDPDTYNSCCWFIYPFTKPNGEILTIRELFPPIARNDTYGGMTDTEIRSLAFERLNKLQSLFGRIRTVPTGSESLGV